MECNLWLLFFLQAENKLAFAVQVLQEVCALLDKDDGSSSWEPSALEHFLNVVNKQADELHACVSGIYGFYGLGSVAPSQWTLIRINLPYEYTDEK